MSEAGFVEFPNSPFQLYQPYPPAGDQPTAIASLVQGVQDGLMGQTLLGVTGSGKTYTMANTIARLGRPALILAPNKTLAAQLYAEMREFSLVMRWSILSLTMIIISLRHMCLVAIYSLRKIQISMNILNKCVCPLPKVYWSVGTPLL